MAVTKLNIFNHVNKNFTSKDVETRRGSLRRFRLCPQVMWTYRQRIGVRGIDPLSSETLRSLNRKVQGLRVLQCHLPSLPLEAPSRCPTVIRIPVPRCAAEISTQFRYEIYNEQNFNNNHPNIQHGEISPSLFGLPHH